MPSSIDVLLALRQLGQIGSSGSYEILGDCFHILQAELYGYQQTKRCSMINGKGLTIEVCGEQYAGDAARC